MRRLGKHSRQQVNRQSGNCCSYWVSANNQRRSVNLLVDHVDSGWCEFSCSSNWKHCSCWRFVCRHLSQGTGKQEKAENRRRSIDSAQLLLPFNRHLSTNWSHTQTLNEGKRDTDTDTVSERKTACSEESAVPVPGAMRSFLMHFTDTLTLNCNWLFASIDCTVLPLAVLSKKALACSILWAAFLVLVHFFTGLWLTLPKFGDGYVNAVGGGSAGGEFGK